MSRRGGAATRRSMLATSSSAKAASLSGVEQETSHSGFAVQLKLLSKRDELTKIKALTQIKTLLPEIEPQEAVSSLIMVSRWSRLCLDQSRFVRENLIQVAGTLAADKNTRKIIEKECFKQFYSKLFLLQFDVAQNVSTAAQSTLDSLFQGSKKQKALMFCLKDIVNDLQSNLDQTLEKLSDSRMFSQEEASDRFERLISASLNASSFLFKEFYSERGFSADDEKSFNALLLESFMISFTEKLFKFLDMDTFTIIQKACLDCLASFLKIDSTDKLVEFEGIIRKVLKLSFGDVSLRKSSWIVLQGFLMHHSAESWSCLLEQEHFSFFVESFVQNAPSKWFSELIVSIFESLPHEYSSRFSKELLELSKVYIRSWSDRGLSATEYQAFVLSGRILYEKCHDPGYIDSWVFEGLRYFSTVLQSSKNQSKWPSLVPFGAFSAVSEVFLSIKKSEQTDSLLLEFVYSQISSAVTSQSELYQKAVADLLTKSIVVILEPRICMCIDGINLQLKSKPSSSLLYLLTSLASQSEDDHVRMKSELACIDALECCRNCNAKEIVQLVPGMCSLLKALQIETEGSPFLNFLLASIGPASIEHFWILLAPLCQTLLLTMQQPSFDEALWNKIESSLLKEAEHAFEGCAPEINIFDSESHLLNLSSDHVGFSILSFLASRNPLYFDKIHDIINSILLTESFSLFAIERLYALKVLVLSLLGSEDGSRRRLADNLFVYLQVCTWIATTSDHEVSVTEEKMISSCSRMVHFVENPSKVFNSFMESNLSLLISHSRPFLFCQSLLERSIGIFGIMNWNLCSALPGRKLWLSDPEALSLVDLSTWIKIVLLRVTSLDDFGLFNAQDVCGRLVDCLALVSEALFSNAYDKQAVETHMLMMDILSRFPDLERMEIYNQLLDCSQQFGRGFSIALGEFSRVLSPSLLESSITSLLSDPQVRPSALTLFRISMSISDISFNSESCEFLLKSNCAVALIIYARDLSILPFDSIVHLLAVSKELLKSEAGLEEQILNISAVSRFLKSLIVSGLCISIPWVELGNLLLTSVRILGELLRPSGFVRKDPFLLHFLSESLTIFEAIVLNRDKLMDGAEVSYSIECLASLFMDEELMSVLGCQAFHLLLLSVCSAITKIDINSVTKDLVPQNEEQSHYLFDRFFIYFSSRNRTIVSTAYLLCSRIVCNRISSLNFALETEIPEDLRVLVFPETLLQSIFSEIDSNQDTACVLKNFLSWRLVIDMAITADFEKKQILSDIIRNSSSELQHFLSVMDLVFEHIFVNKSSLSDTSVLSAIQPSPEQLEPNRAMLSVVPSFCKTLKRLQRDLKEDTHLDVFFSPLCCNFMFSCLKAFPALCRLWYSQIIDRSYTGAVSNVVSSFFSPYLITEEFSRVSDSFQISEQEGFRVRINSALRSIVVEKTDPELIIRLSIKIPECFPLIAPEVSIDAPSSLSGQVKKWELNILLMLKSFSLNKSLAEACNSWQQSVDKHFEGIEECTICYSILHSSSGALPTIACKTCSHKVSLIST